MQKYIFFIFFIYLISLHSQNIGPVIQNEKRPTTKSPSYKPSLIPFYLQQKSQLSPLESYIINPAQNPEDYLKNSQKKQDFPIKIPKQEEELLNTIYQDTEKKYMDSQQFYFKKYFLPQFGTEFQNIQIYKYLPEPEYKETLWQRRFTIFMLSFPVTTGISYGIYRNYKIGQGLSPGLNQKETITIFSIGIISSFLIVYYDEHYNKSIIEYSRYLKNQN